MTPEQISELRQFCGQRQDVPSFMMAQALDEIERLKSRVAQLEHDCIELMSPGAFVYLDGERQRLQRETDTYRHTAEGLHKKYLDLERKLEMMAPKGI